MLYTLVYITTFLLSILAVLLYAPVSCTAMTGAVLLYVGGVAAPCLAAGELLDFSGGIIATAALLVLYLDKEPSAKEQR